MKKMHWIIIVVIVLVIGFFAHMRFACTGTYKEGGSIEIANASGDLVDGGELCVYYGWKDFKFKLFKRWSSWYRH